MEYYKKQTRYEIRYVSKDGTEKSCYPKSEEKKKENLAYCKEHGIRVLFCKKLYPFSTERNQHNFMLISNICRNRMSDMESGEIPMDQEEYDRLDGLRERADKYYSLPLPVAWMTWDELSEAKTIASMAVMHRQDACIEAGRYDLVKYC